MWPACGYHVTFPNGHDAGRSVTLPSTTWSSIILQARTLLIVWTLLGCIFAATCPAEAEELDGLLERAHPWARFGKGAWRHVRIVTENYDAEGVITDGSLTDNKTTVTEVTPERVTLQVEVTVEVAGQKFPSQPQIIVQGYAGETLGKIAPAKPLEPQTVTIDGREIRCEARQLEISGGVTHEQTQIVFAAGHEPPILRRQSTLREAGDGKELQEITSQVMSLHMIRHLVQQERPQNVYLVRTNQKNDRGTTITWSWHAPDVPGEVVDECSHKTDAEGRVVRRTTLELVGYGLGEPVEVETDGPSDTSPRRTRRGQRRAR